MTVDTHFFGQSTKKKKKKKKKQRGERDEDSSEESEVAHRSNLGPLPPPQKQACCQ